MMWLTLYRHVLARFLILGAGGLCGFDMKHGFKIVRRDHHKTESPNAGYPESAMAGLLGVQISGTYTYFGKEKAKPTLGEALEPIHMKHVYQTKNSSDNASMYAYSYLYCHYGGDIMMPLHGAIFKEPMRLMM